MLGAWLITAIGTGDNGEGKNVSGSVFEGRVKGKVKEGIMAYQMTEKQILSGIAEARGDIKEAGYHYREEYQYLGTKRQDIKAYLKQLGST